MPGLERDAAQRARRVDRRRAVGRARRARRQRRRSCRRYEERFLFLLLLLRQPRLRVIYVTGRPVAREHRRVLPRAAAGRHPEPRPRAAAHGRRRTTARRARWPTKLLERPRVLGADPRAASPTARAAISSRTRRRRSSATSRSRSASRSTAPTRGCCPSARRPAAGGCSPRRASPHPLGLRGPARRRRRGRRARAACARRGPAMRERDRQAQRGRRRAAATRVVDLRGLPAPGLAPTSRRRCAARVEAMAFEHPDDRARPTTSRGSREGGGIVEERVGGDELRSPSVQLRVTPLGEVELLSTHDQLLGGPSGQSYLGCRFPADFGYARAITREAAKIGAAARARGRARPLRRRLRRRARRARAPGRRTRSSSTCARAARRTRS